MAICDDPDCDRTARTRGWCHTHYERRRRNGELTLVREKDPVVRFWSYVDTSGDCWLWLGADNGHGYGATYFEGKQQQAHRVAYKLLVGPIPNGLQLDHLCRNRACVRPDHLEAVDIRTNLIRGNGTTGVNFRRTHCKHGHPFTTDNTYNWNGIRQCRSCRDRRREQWRERHAAGETQRRR